MLRSVLLTTVLALLATGCDSVEDEFVALPVVSATLETGEPLPDIRLTRLALLNTTYDPSAQAIRDAEVEVVLAGENGAPDQAIAYQHVADGVYSRADSTSATVLGGRTYRLRALVPSPDGAGRDTLRAETVAPPAVEIVEAPPDEVVYGEGFGPEVRLTTSSTAARRAVYVISSTALQADEFEPVIVDGERRFRQRGLPNRFGLVPVAELFNGCDPDDIGRLVCDTEPGGGRSPLLNEDNYELLGDGTARVAIPFIAFTFYGPQAVTFFSLDDALVAFVETQAIQTAPTTISPGEVPNVTTNVENGLGVFGSLARATVYTSIREPGT